MVMLRYAWEYDDPDHVRPAEVARLEAFLNTVDHHTFGEHAAKPAHRRDLLATPDGLQHWLVEQRLVDRRADPAALTVDDLKAAQGLRDGLRAWLLARQRLDHDAAALQRARAVLAGLQLRVDLDAAGSAALDPATGGALGRLAADLATAQATGALLRLKICSAPDCRFVYHDHSRSRTSRWCSTDTCGNRVKTRRYRERRRN